MTKEKTISDYIAKDNKKLPFEDRARKFELAIEPFQKELGVMPWAQLIQTESALVAMPGLKDLWESGKE